MFLSFRVLIPGLFGSVGAPAFTGACSSLIQQSLGHLWTQFGVFFLVY